VFEFVGDFYGLGHQSIKANREFGLRGSGFFLADRMGIPEGFMSRRKGSTP